MEETGRPGIGIGVKPRQPLPSERDPHSQQRSMGVAVLYVAHDRLQIFSVAGTEGPVGLRQTRPLGEEGSLGHRAEKWEGRRIEARGRRSPGKG